MKRFLSFVVTVTVSVMAFGQANIQVKSGKPAGTIDPMLYGQLFEHIYFSANNGVWQELMYGRSFEPEHYPGIPPRDGYFDGWFADDDAVLHSPTRYEQPIRLAALDTDSYDLEMDVKWRAYLLPGRRWSGGLLDLRFAFKDLADGSDSYYLRLYDPAYEGQRFALAQTQAQIEADNQAKALAKAQKAVDGAQFALSVRQEKEVAFGPRTRKVVTLEPLAAKAAQPVQLDQEAWHHLKISCRGQRVRVWWDGKQVLSCKVPDSRPQNTITLWENYTEALYKNIRVTSADGKKVLFEGLPEDVRIPDVAPEWVAFGEGSYRLVKGDAINMTPSIWTMPRRLPPGRRPRASPRDRRTWCPARRSWAQSMPRATPGSPLRWSGTGASCGSRHSASRAPRGRSSTSPCRPASCPATPTSPSWRPAARCWWTR